MVVVLLVHQIVDQNAHEDSAQLQYLILLQVLVQLAVVLQRLGGSSERLELALITLILHLVQHLPRDAVLLHQATDAVIDRAKVLVDQRLQLLALRDRVVLLGTVQVVMEQVVHDAAHHADEVVKIVLVVDGQLTAVVHVEHARVLLPNLEVLLVQLEVQVQFEL